MDTSVDFAVSERALLFLFMIALFCLAIFLGHLVGLGFQAINTEWNKLIIGGPSHP